MSNKQLGPAGGTRSRANSGKPTKLPPLPPDQKLVSSFLTAKSKAKDPIKYDSDSEANITKRRQFILRKRSNSGIIYQSTTTIEAHGENISLNKSAMDGTQAISAHQQSKDIGQQRNVSVETSPQYLSTEHSSRDSNENVKSTEQQRNSLQLDDQDEEARTQSANTTGTSGSEDKQRISNPNSKISVNGTTTTFVTSKATQDVLCIYTSMSSTIRITPSCSDLKDAQNINTVFGPPQVIHTVNPTGSMNANLLTTSMAGPSWPQPIGLSTFTTQQLPPITTPMATNDSMMLMLQNISSQLTVISTDIKYLKVSKRELAEQINGMDYDLEEVQDQMITQKKESAIQHDQVELLTGIVSRQGEQIQDLHNRVIQLESKDKRSELIIFGLQEDKKEEQTCKEIVVTFLKEKLKIEQEQVPTIVHAYWKGKGKNRPAVIRLANVQEKKLIFSHVSNLKEVVNQNQRPYRILDHLPEKLAEEQTRQRQIVARNKQNPANKQEMEIKKGKLFIGKQQYKKKVVAPSATKLMHMDTSEIKDASSIRVADGGSETEKGSRFLAYAMEVSSLKSIRQAYIHIKRLHPRASHATMAYRLAGIDKAYDEDYVDDGEHSGGRKLLDMLKIAL